MQKFSLRITGSGFPEDIARRLREAADAIDTAAASDLDGAVWEDETLLTEIDIIEE